jgi:hypothetical protein
MDKIQVEFEKGRFDYTSSPRSSVDMDRAFSDQQKQCHDFPQEFHCDKDDEYIVEDHISS